jgi:predicted PurR-regulated permease PerM
MTALHRVEISTHTILSIFGIIFGLYLIYRLQNIIILLFIVFLFATAVNPFVNYLEKAKIPRGLSILITFMIVFITLGLLIAIIMPPLVSEGVTLLSQIQLPSALQQNLSQYNLQELQILANQLTSLPKIINAVSSTFSLLAYLFTFMVIAYYFLIERPNLHHYLVHVMGNNLAENQAEHFVGSLESKIGGWVRGQLAVISIFAFMIFVGLTLMQVPYAIPLAILAGIADLIPNIGGFIAIIPAILIAYFVLSPPMAIAVIALYVLVQQIEHNFIIPSIMRRVVGLNPLITIIIFFVGLELLGIWGAILAIPAYLVIRVFITEWRKMKQPAKVIAKALEKLE